MAHEYAQLADIKDTLELSSETFADADIQLALAAASRAIDNICQRRFWSDADATSVRYYTPRRSFRLLEIDDLVTLTALDTDPNGDSTWIDAWTINTDFVLEPLNATADGEPATMIRVHPNGRFRLPGNRPGSLNRATLPKSVRVTGKFGWPAIPTEITQATGILGSRLMRRSREAPFGLIGFSMEQGVGAVANLARNDPDVMMLVGPYIRKLVF